MTKRWRRTGAQLIWETLLGEGVHTVFGYPGGAILPAYDAMLDYPIRHILVRHEQGATHMADGYSRASGEVGVAVATSGPGATNMVTGIATAMLDSSPIVCVTGQVGSALIGTDAFQETDVTGVTLPITKHNYLVTEVDEIAPALHEAFYVARSGRPGPVLVDITKDAQQAFTATRPRLGKVDLPGYRPEPRPPESELQRAAELINRAERPVILAGHGILISGAMGQVRELAERARIPIAMTLLGIGAIPANHALNMGMMGMHGESWVNQAIQEADLLLALGMRFDDRVTGSLKTYAPNAAKIHIDIDPAEFNKNVRVDVALAGDLSAVLAHLLPVIEARDRSEWLGSIRGFKGDTAVRDIQNLPDMGKLYAAHVIHDIWRMTGGKAIVTTDVGQHQMWEAQYYRHNEPRSLITSGGLGTMGFALPAAVGAKVARPDDEVWVIAGDGGFQMTMCELATIAQERLKLNVAIINNGYLGMVRQWQEFFYDRRYAGTPILSPDFAALARSFGLGGEVVKSRQEVEGAIERARADERTVVLDFQVEKEDTVYPMVPTGARLQDMIRRPGQEADGDPESEEEPVAAGRTVEW
ncbi:MAG: biosynthetic-type acetolactate synthase large subunit [Acidobacteria bacterium]|nr:biosynthetic-type acetolactate synthase large subunit [Acidobacteriota bacterium]MYA46970.1 biosynthetic-type acetolactate synthase large subunit [Acidobacteriota bacterium]MYI39333.1 biosynthetic-type acetolactate synthase large subunit [Acidobacteriota bacterium]